MSLAMKRALVLILAALAVAALFASMREVPEGSMDRAPGPTAMVLPIEARETLDRIVSGGPFEYARDGSTFQNREHRLPERPAGYYREYTVETPGARDRGARRIVAGGDPPEVFYYTDDHYRTFRGVEASDGRR
jgi:guanyl-specific ribonuclease Sa